MENQNQVLQHIREENGHASSKTIMTLLNKDMNSTNELIDYLRGEKHIEEPQRRNDGNRTSLKITNSGINYIIKNK